MRRGSRLVNERLGGDRAVESGFFSTGTTDHGMANWIMRCKWTAKRIRIRKREHQIGKIAMNQGMKTLRHVALDKVREGLTTLEQTLVITSSH